MTRLASNRTLWCLILGVALALRLGAGWWWQSRLAPAEPFYFGDSVGYWELAREIARGEPYAYPTPEFRAFRTPGYPLVLAGLFRLFGDDPPILAARALSAVLGTLAVGLVGWWTTQLFDARAGRIAGWIAALYPGGISMGAFVLSEAPFCPWMLLQFMLWGMASQNASAPRAGALAAGGGLCAAIATLIRPSWLLFTPFAAIIALALAPPRGRQAWLGLSLCAALALGMTPWWIRNAQVTGHFVATTLQFGASAYDALSPSATGASDMSFVPEFEALERAAPSGAADDTFEYRLDRRLQRAATDWVVANPARVAQLAWIKFLRTWNLWPNEPSLRAWPLRLVVLATYGPLLCLGVLGAVRFTRRGWPYVLAWLPALYFALMHLVFLGSIRYREPAMLALTVLAAGWLAEMTRRGDTAPAGARAEG